MTRGIPRNGPASREDLAAAVELNSADWLRFQAVLPWVRVEEADDVQVVKCFRRRGIGSALVAPALRKGKELGYTWAVLSATATGAGVYERQGFHEVGQLSFWRYGKMRQLKQPHFFGC